MAFENIDVTNLEIIFQQELIENSSSDNLSQPTNSFNLIENQEDINLNETCSAHENTGSVAPNELQDVSSYVVEETIVDSFSSLHSGKEIDTVIDVSTNESLDSTSQLIGNLKDNPDNILSSLHGDTEKDTVSDLSTSCPSISMSQSIITDFNSDKNLTTEQTILSKTLNQNEEAKVVTTNDDLNISQKILKFAKIPQFKPKKRKVETSEVTVNTVGKVLETLHKKENEKILRQTQIELNKKKKEEKRVLKDKEKTIAKSFKEKRKHLINDKKKLNSQIKALKITIKNEVNKENLVTLEEQTNTLINNIAKIEGELVNVEVQSLQSKIKIKQEQI